MEPPVEGKLALTPWFPPYSWVRALLPILDGVPRRTVTSMMATIMEATGTPQNPVDWTKPQEWIPERLEGSERDLAWRIWKESEGIVNPRHLRGSLTLIDRHGLLTTTTDGSYRLTEAGQRFLKDDAEIIALIDRKEGIDHLLGLLATGSATQRGDLLPEWWGFLRQYTTFQTESVASDTLRRRLTNLMQRGLVVKEGLQYRLAAAAPASVPAPPRVSERAEAVRGIAAYNAKQREALREHLANVHPSAFEGVVAQLLEAMGYDDVEVTGRSGDMGVDVTGTLQVGITTVREFVQVKRHRKTIQRKTVDQLRGALPYHGAIRGTLITLSDFSSGCAEAALFPGAAPITLIDGDRLIDLLIKHNLGVRKQQFELVEVDQEFFEGLGNRYDGQ